MKYNERSRVLRPTKKGEKFNYLKVVSLLNRGIWDNSDRGLRSTLNRYGSGWFVTSRSISPTNNEGNYPDSRLPLRWLSSPHAFCTLKAIKSLTKDKVIAGAIIFLQPEAILFKKKKKQSELISLEGTWQWKQKKKEMEGGGGGRESQKNKAFFLLTVLTDPMKIIQIAADVIPKPISPPVQNGAILFSVVIVRLIFSPWRFWHDLTWAWIIFN